MLTPDELAMYERAKARCLPADCAAYLERGRAALRAGDAVARWSPKKQTNPRRERGAPDCRLANGAWRGASAASIAGFASGEIEVASMR